jgi:hypothetical protein
MTNGPIYVQHKARQQEEVNRRKRRPSAFSPLDITNGPWKEGLGEVGKYIGTAVGAILAKKAEDVGRMKGSSGEVYVKQAQDLGSSGGEQIGFYIDNADSIITNVLTVIANPLSSFEDLDSENSESDQL